MLKSYINKGYLCHFLKNAYNKIKKISIHKYTFKKYQFKNIIDRLIIYQLNKLLIIQ